jgi:hypothetical protein
VAAEHDHARDPEEEDVEAGDEELRGIEGGEVGREFVAAVPAEDGEGQQAGGEPGVEDVGLLAMSVMPQPLQAVGVAGDGDAAAGVAVPRGDAMAPPELAGDAPVVDVVHPLHVGLAVLSGVNLMWPCSTAAGCFVGERLNLDEPLHREARLDDDAGALRDGDRHGCGP